MVDRRTGSVKISSLFLDGFCILAAALACLLSSTQISEAQQSAPRITSPIDNSTRATIPNTRPAISKASGDLGSVPSETILKGITIVFRRTSAQESALEALIAAQQSPRSPHYQKWLTPDEFAANFGLADSDMAKVQAWLEEQGFSVDHVSRGKNRIAFSGTVGHVTSAFGVELHYYRSGRKKHYAPSGNVSVPAALSSIVETVGNLSSVRPRPRVKFRKKFTSSQSGDHFLTPKDVATMYDIKAAYDAGYTGTGQSIAIVGQSAIDVSDVENFQTATGQSVKDPTLVLVPSSGSSTISSGDEAESDLDLEYSGGVATGATIYFVYVGNNSSYSVWDSISYAVDTRIAPIISTSYGVCETELTSADYSTLNAVLEQAAAQGQTVLSAAGDSGSTDCYGYTDLTTTEQEALAVDFPASSQYVTAMGGTEFPASDVASTNTAYWESAGGSDVISSALSYIPEQVWNDDSSSSGLSSGGGGVSTLTSRPSWQTGVTGIPSGSYRLVPDIALDASPNNAGYLYCSSDSTATGITGSCSNGFRDSSDVYLTIAGGTSFDGPIFAGMMAIINQKLNSTGQGVVNATLYSLAADSTTYASAFHDIISSGNQCSAGSAYCSTLGESDYKATTGYDEASGLGSIDFYNLLTVWPTTTFSSLTASRTSLSAASASPSAGSSDAITIIVTTGSTSVTSTPTGTVTVLVDGATETSTLALLSGSATYTFSSSTTGTHVITVTYSGDSTFAPSTGSASVSVGAASGSFSLSATNVTVSAGSSGTSTITVTPKNNYTGTIGWSVASSPTMTNGCYSISSTTVSGTAAVTAALTIYTASSACASAAMKGTNGRHTLQVGNAIGSIDNGPTFASGNGILALPIAVLLLAGSLSFRARGHRRYAALLPVAILSAALIGCGSGSSSSSSSSKVTTGTYTLTITGTDASSSSITATTTVTLTVD